MSALVAVVVEAQDQLVMVGRGIMAVEAGALGELEALQKAMMGPLVETLEVPGILRRIHRPVAVGRVMVEV
jgi:hypothetical protein